MKHCYFLIILLLAGSVSAVSLGYVTGNDYIKMKGNDKSAWLVGAIDGIIAESISNSRETTPWLSSCIAQHELNQIKAIFEKELDENPESRHAPAAFIFRKRIADFCSA